MLVLLPSPAGSTLSFDLPWANRSPVRRRRVSGGEKRVGGGGKRQVGTERAVRDGLNDPSRRGRSLFIQARASLENVARRPRFAW